MRRSVAAALVVAVVLSALPALSGVSGADVTTSAPAGAAPPASAEQPDSDRSGTWIGEIDGTDVAVAVISDGTLVRAYTCDGGAISAWFEGELVGNSFLISAPDGSTITGALSDGGATGVFTSTDGPASGSFSATRPTGGGGVFRSYFVTEDAAGVFIRWIVFDDGRQRGNAETTTAAGTETAPAPPLPAPAARIEATAPVGPAGDPAPVVELTPKSISAPVPTTQLAGAPAPIPPPAPPAIQPLALSAKVTPAKAETNAPVRYQLTLTNPNTTELADAGVRVGLPPGLAVRPNTDKTICKGTFVAFPPGATRPGDPQLIVSKVTLAPGAACTADVDIVGAAPVAVDVVTDAPTAAGAPPGTPARVTFVIGSSVAAPAATPPTTRPSTTTTKPAATTTTKPAATTTTTTRGPTTTTTRPPTTTTTTPGTATPSAASAPSKPRNVKAKALPLRPGDGASDGRVEVSFDPPASNGGSPTFGFEATCGTGTQLSEASGDASPLTVTGLPVDVELVCFVFAINAAGKLGPLALADPTVTVASPSAPSKPRNVKAKALPLRSGDGLNGGRVDVSFQPPESDGGAPIVGFEATCGTVARSKEASSDASPVTVTGLPVDVPLVCFVFAINRAGKLGQVATAEALVTASTPAPPAAPRNVTVKALPLRPGDGRTSGRVEVSFDPPERDGGSLTFIPHCAPVTNPDSIFTGDIVQGPSSPLTVTGLPVDVELQCRVFARSEFPKDSAEVFADRTVAVLSKPRAPTNVKAKALPLREGDGPKSGRVEMTFDAPPNPGGVPVTFIPHCAPVSNPDSIFTGDIVQGPAPPLTITGLPVDVDLHCRVFARTQLGDSDEVFADKSVAIVVRSRPPAPGDVRAVALPLRRGDGPKDGRVEMLFDAPRNDGGAPLTFIPHCARVGDREGGLFTGDLVQGRGSPLIVTGLPVDVPLQCRVFARSAFPADSDEVFAREVVTVVSRPSPPRDVKAKALPLLAGDGPKNGRVEVSFRVPEQDGGSPVTFIPHCAPVSNPESLFTGDLVQGKRSPVVVTGLPVDVELKCRLFGRNEFPRDSEEVFAPGTVTVVSRPLPPTDVKAKALPLRAGDGAKDGRVELSFGVPEQLGAPVTFIPHCARVGDPEGGIFTGDLVQGPESPLIMTGLPVDVGLVCRVFARSPFPRDSEEVFAPGTVTVRTKPLAPSNVTATALPLRAGDGPKDGRVRASFDAPRLDAGAAPVTFIPHCARVGDRDGGIFTGDLVQGPASPLTITGLPVDVELQCRVFARSEQGDSDELFAAKTVTVEGVLMLVAEPGSGSAPLPVTFTLLHAPKEVKSWELDFGDGTPKVKGQGAVPVVPHTYVNRREQAITPSAALRVTPADGKETVLTLSVEVQPAGTVLTVDAVPSPATVQRGADGTISLTVRNPNVTPVPGPLTVSVPPSIKVAFVGPDWACVETVCAITAGLDAFATAPPLSARFTAPINAPATFEVPFEVSAGDSVTIERRVRVPVVGVFANAGPDQTVDAVTPSPDGTLVATRVLLDAGSSLGLDGKNQTFSWKKISGPSVSLDTSIHPDDRVVAFAAPAVTAQTALEFEVTVADGPNTSKDRVRVTVFPRNQPPVLRKIAVSGLDTQTRKNSGEIVPQGEGTLTLTADAADPDGDQLATSWRVLTQGASGTDNGKTFSLKWPITGIPQVIVEATVSDPRGAVDSATVTLGVAPDPLGLEVVLPARGAAGERITARATPSRTSGVRVNWVVLSGAAPGGFPKTTRNIEFDAPDVDTTQVTTLEVTATETATGASATRQVAFEVQAGAPLTLSVPPAVAVDTGEAASIEATVDGPGNRTLQWTQTFGPDVQLQDATARTVRFDAPGNAATIGLRLTASAGGATASANTIVTVGAPAAALASGCGDGSAYQQFADGGPVVLAGGLAVLTGFTAQGTNGNCDEATLEDVDVVLVNGLVVGDDLGGTVDQGRVRLTEGTVRLPPAFQLPDIDLGGAPLEVAFDGGGATPSGGGDPCINWDAALSSARFPFVPLPPGFTGAGARVALTCTSASITAEAAAGGATFAVDAELNSDGGANATVTLTDVTVLGGSASGTGSIAVAPGGAATYDLSATVTNPELPIPGLDLDTATARLTPQGLTIAAEGSLGQGSGAIAVAMEGAFTEDGISLAVEASNAAPWEVGPGLTVEAANLIGTVDINEAGAATVDLRLSVGGDWRPVPGLRVRQLSLQVANTAVPPECAIPAGGLWVRVAGEGAIEIPGVSPITLAVEACLGPPADAGTPAFSLRSTVAGPQWPVAAGVVIRDVGIQVTFIDGTLTLEASGSATLLGLDLTARVLFLLPSGGGAPTVVVDASGDLTGIGIPIPEAHVVFASAAVSDFELAPGLEIDLPQGITGVGTIDLGQPIADLLNDAFSPPTPILPTVIVTVSFGAAIEIKATINLGGDGATLFMGCPGGGVSCNPTAPTTTRLALTSAFIRLVLGGSGGFSIGFGGDGTLNLPPAEGGLASPPLNLHVEASIQPPARVGLAMFFEGSLQNAMGLSGLTLSNLGIQGSIDFSTTPVPLVTIGITGQVDHVPDALADVLGLTNSGEPMRFTINVDPLAPILELTLGVDDGAIVMRPLAALGQPDALEVDFASVVIAPLGGTVGPVSYSPGVSAGFGANIMGVPVHVNASIDIAAAHLNGTVEVGTLSIGGVTFEDTTVLVDITPQRFRQTLCGGVHIGSTTLQGLLHIQAGSGGGGAASCGDVSLSTGGSPAGLNARFRLHADALPIGPVNVEELDVDAQAELDALSSNFNATLNVTAKINVLANELDVEGTIKFGTTGVKELHVKAIGNVNVGGVEITGDGTCGFPASSTSGSTFPGSKGGGKSIAIGGQATSGACVQLDHAPGTSTPFRFGLKGKLTAAGSTASIKAALDQSQADVTGTLNVPTLGNLNISGKLVFGSGVQIANATGANVNASPGDWRVSGQFASAKNLAGGVSARWTFAAGRVSGGLFVRGSASVSIAGVSVNLAGTFSATSSGALSYSLSGSSSAATSFTFNLGKTGGGSLNLLHSAIRVGVFNFPGISPIGGRNSDENFPEQMKGRLHFDASYNIDATLTQTGLDIDEADLSAKVVYGERFDRDGNGAFGEEGTSKRNTLVNFNVDASGIDEFFEMALADAASRVNPPSFCFAVFGQEFGSC